jgi:CheY-like chemotaxis protein
MYSRTQSALDNQTDRPLASYNLSIKRLDFRSALVIEKSDALRRSIVQHLKNKGWIVHGIRRAEQALPVLRHIPYHLILIDSELSGMTATQFARVIHESGKFQATQLVIITGSPGRYSAAELTECAAFLARRPNWKDDLSRLLANVESPDKIFD